MTILTAGSVMLFPRININEDMTQYLPDDSRMKAGVDSLKAYFPEVDMNAWYIKAMFEGVTDRDSLGKELSSFEGVSGITAVSEKDGYTMYQLSVQPGADPKTIAPLMRERFGDDVTVEHNANSIMPDNMTFILIAAVVIVFGILFLMCSSFVEALLFIIAIGMAVILNTGTNAFLPSVSMLTNAIAAVLQLVLSMDYSIILMNRFRQINTDEPDIDRAMGKAVKSASPTILSSSFTTVVGLLALVFMKFKIGLDLGLVLAKGVLLSLISIYTILPALILLFHRGIKMTEKKVFLVPTDSLARFELKARVPLAVLFVLIFGASWHLSRKTELSYASIWESKINDVFPPQNSFSLLYRTSSEDKIIGITDSLMSDPKVLIALSYPSIFNRELDAGQMCGNIRELLSLLASLPGAEIPDIQFDQSLLTPETLRVLYYAANHKERDERMSFEDMIRLADEASGSGLLPEGMDVEAIMADFFASEIEEMPEPEPLAEPVVAVGAGKAEKPAEDPAVPADSLQAPAKETQTETGGLSLAEIARPTVDESGDDPYGLQNKYSFTKEKLNTQMSSLEMADYLGFSKAQASAAYSMAKKKNGTMTPDEFIDYMIDKVLGNRLLSKMISDGQAEGLYFIRGQMDEVLAAPDVPASAATETAAVTAASASPATPAAPSVPVGPAAPAGQETVVPEPAVPEAERIVKELPITAPVEYSPMDRLAEMYASGRKYSSSQIYKALHNAGIDILNEGMTDLMFTYYGSRNNPADSTKMSLNGIIDFLSEEVASNDAYSAFIPDSIRTVLGGLRGMVDDGMKMLRKDEWSMAAIVTDYPLESAGTFDFVGNTIAECREEFGDDGFFLIGEPVMYKEMKDGFRRELLLLTLLTVISIFIIVAVSFKSLVIPTILVMTVLSGVFVNVFFSGIGDRTMLYLAYLIVQSILMGSTIDYGILYTNCYLEHRRNGIARPEALRQAYRDSIHTIMTSGLIIICAPFIMSELLTDPALCSILSSLTVGAVAAISLILLVLPALLAVTDRLIVRKADC